MKPSLSFLLIGCLLTAPVSAEESVELSGIVNQRDFKDSINGCAPASVLNLLKFSDKEYHAAYNGLVGGDDEVRMRFLVDRYFRSRPSVVYPTQKRWGAHGVQTADLVTGLNELLEDEGLPPLTAQYLDRKEGENEKKHLARCHQLISASLEKGVKPILSLRSFRVREREDGKKGWDTAVHHNVVIHSLDGDLSTTGFSLTALDPNGGKVVRLYIHREGNGQSFRALKGVEESGRWLNGKPFLQVVAPDVVSLRPRDLEWSERFLVVANFLIGDF